MRHLLSVDDLDDDDIESIHSRARDLNAGSVPSSARFFCGLLFTTPSLRTRVGFAVAAHRVGGAHVDVFEQRFASNMSAPESFEDTLRTLSGMVDVIVTRTAGEVTDSAVRQVATCPVVGAGGLVAHPTQALIDLAAIEERAPVGKLTIGLCGDLQQRSARSLLRLLDRRPPAGLVVMAPAERDVDLTTIAPRLVPIAQRRSPDDVAGLDVLYLPGFPPGGNMPVSDEIRHRYALTASRISSLPADARVLSPLPVIDEVEPAARSDSRVGWWRQSDYGVFVRMAVLETVLSWNAKAGRRRNERYLG